MPRAASGPGPLVLGRVPEREPRDAWGERSWSGVWAFGVSGPCASDAPAAGLGRTVLAGPEVASVLLLRRGTKDAGAGRPLWAAGAGTLGTTLRV